LQPLFPHDHLLSPATKLPDDCESFEKYKITKENIAKTVTTTGIISLFIFSSFLKMI